MKIARLLPAVAATVAFALPAAAQADVCTTTTVGSYSTVTCTADGSSKDSYGTGSYGTGGSTDSYGTGSYGTGGYDANSYGTGSYGTGGYSPNSYGTG